MFLHTSIQYYDIMKPNFCPGAHPRSLSAKWIDYSQVYGQCWHEATVQQFDTTYLTASLTAVGKKYIPRSDATERTARSGPWLFA